MTSVPAGNSQMLRGKSAGWEDLNTFLNLQNNIFRPNNLTDGQGGSPYYSLP